MYKFNEKNGEKIQITNKPKSIEGFIDFKKPMSGYKITIIVLSSLLVLALLVYALK